MKIIHTLKVDYLLLKYPHNLLVKRLLRIERIAICICFVGGSVVCFLLQLSERWSCHIWVIGRIKFASLEANLGLY